MEHARIENWSEINGRIWGDIYGDPLERWEDGALITTSQIQDGILMEDQVIITQNSTYVLGKPGDGQEILLSMVR